MRQNEYQHSTLMPLHPAQRGIYFKQAAIPESPKYNVGGYIRIVGDFDATAFREALLHFWRANEAERLQFLLVEGAPLQRICYDVPAPNLPELEFNIADARRWMQARMDSAFDLKKFPLTEHALLRIGGDEVWYFSRHHHLIADAYSFGLKIHQTMDDYRRLRARETIDDLPVPSYAEEVAASLRYVQSDDFATDRTYWLDRMRNPPPLIWPQVGGVESGEELSIVVPTDLQRAFLQATQVANSGPLTVLLALTAVHLARGRGSDEALLVGVPLHNRVYRRQKRTFGKLSAMIPVRVGVDARVSLLAMFRRLRAEMAEDLQHRHFNAWQDVMHMVRTQDPQRTTMFDLVVNYEPFLATSAYPGTQLAAYELTSTALDIPMHLKLCDFGPDQPMVLKIDAAHEVLPPGGIQAFATDLIETMGIALGQPERPLSELFDISLGAPR